MIHLFRLTPDADKVPSPAAIESLFLRLLRDKDHAGYTSYGYDVYLPTLANAHLQKIQPKAHGPAHNEIRDLVNKFYPIAWRLCLRGILRPGINSMDGQSTDDGVSNGYSLTPVGAAWLASADKNDFLPTEPERFALMLAPHRAKFGDVFHERAQEAMRCYGAQANLACCVMCGAAAEAVLLVTAEAKIGETEAQADYKNAAGRSKLINRLLGQSPLKTKILPYLELIDYWRTTAAHAKAAQIDENVAYTSLVLLLRFATFTSDNWDELVRP